MSANTSACTAAVVARIAERDRDGSDALARALDALIHEPVGVTVRVLAMIFVRMLVVVLVGPGVWMGVA